MLVLDNLNIITPTTKPCALTFGSFDGIHRGHLQILNRMKEIAKTTGTVCVLTFSNHPSQVLPGKTSIQFILSQSLKLKILEELGVNLVYYIEFTPELAKVNYKTFLEQIKKSCSFDHLVLGEGASFGKNREGSPDKIKLLSKEMGFSVEYLPKLTHNNEQISSGKIRTLIKSGELQKVREFLGRFYSIEGIFENGRLILDPNLCLPPNGDYPVIVSINSDQKSAIAHIQSGKIFLNSTLKTGKILISFS